MNKKDLKITQLLGFFMLGKYFSSIAISPEGDPLIACKTFSQEICFKGCKTTL